MAKSKIEEVYNNMLGDRPKSIKEELNEKIKDDSFVRVNFFISKKQKEKLKEYTKQIAPAHIKISQSELIRYFIENFDLKKAQENYFKIK